MASPNPAAPCRAVLDVGTNSVKLLVGRVAGTAVTPLHERGIQTRLGAGLFASRRLLPDAIARTADAVRTLAAEARTHRPERLRLLATAAAREALNPEDLIAALQSACDATPEIIDGATEAELAFRGVTTHPELAELPLLVSDAGGGSTEFIVGHRRNVSFRQSFPIGAVRLLESLSLPDPPNPDDLDACRQTLDALFASRVIPALAPFLSADTPSSPLSRPSPLRWVAVGGTAVILARLHLALDTFDRDRIESVRLDPATLRSLTERLWAMPVADRRRLPGLPPERADIILTGAALYEAAFRALRLPALQPSTRGLRFAALLDPP
ncbi:MAG: hypothetical protein KF833_11325 [Verrucomicrobiae bacterium]|nr:hypothetical protein [Verrucomicrobiae bacterium]